MSSAVCRVFLTPCAATSGGAFVPEKHRLDVKRKHRYTRFDIPCADGGLSAQNPVEHS